MTSAINMLRHYARAYLGHNDEGQGVVEYSLIVGTISVVLIGAFMVSGISGAVTGLATAITNAITSRNGTGI